METVTKTRSALARLWGRLWATLALACVISLAGTSVATAMDVTSELAAPNAVAGVAAAADTGASGDEANGSADEQAPTQHCALCCLHACSSFAAAAITLPHAPMAAALPVATGVAALASDSLSTQDQPPRG
jgi:hypothetical protein